MTENAFIKTLSNYQFKIQENRNQLCQLEKTLPNNILNRLSSLKRNFDLKTKIFEGTDPEKPLKKGYSLIYDQDNHLIKEVKALKVGEKVKLKVKDGSAESRIEKINANF